MSDDPAQALGAPAPLPPLPATVLERAELPLTDLGHASRIAAVYRHDVIYCCELGFGVWDGARYDFGTTAEARVLERCARLPDILREEVEQWCAAPIPPDEIQLRLEQELRKSRAAFIDEEGAKQAIRADRRKRHEAEIKQVGQVRKIASAAEALKFRLRVPFEAIDADPYAFHMANGVIDLRRVLASDPQAFEREDDRRREWLLGHDRARLPSRASGVMFDPAAECPRWRDFIGLISSPAQGGFDVAMAAYFQRCFGRLVFGRNEPPTAFLLQGEGANGKSTLMRILSEALGSYGAHVPVAMFLDQGDEKASSAAAPDEVRLPGARAYFASEPRHGARLSDAKIKQLAGGDKRPGPAKLPRRLPRHFEALLLVDGCERGLVRAHVH
ncbi:MAG: hypothetical protein AAFY59_17225, partial [Pseudomonadota bacterium]